MKNVLGIFRNISWYDVFIWACRGGCGVIGCKSKSVFWMDDMRVKKTAKNAVEMYLQGSSVKE